VFVEFCDAVLSLVAHSDGDYSESGVGCQGRAGGRARLIGQAGAGVL
jgi:hypothetical protein